MVPLEVRRVSTGCSTKGIGGVYGVTLLAELPNHLERERHARGRDHGLVSTMAERCVIVRLQPMAHDDR